MRIFIFIALLASTLVMAQSNHSSYRVGIESLILEQCGIHIDLVQTEMFTVSDGMLGGEITTVTCPQGNKITVTFKPPTTRNNCQPLDVDKLRYEIEIVGNVVQRMRACDDGTDNCSIWVKPGEEVKASGC